MTWARQQRHRRENKGPHTCRQKLEQTHTRCVAAASCIRAVTNVKKGEDTDALVIIADLHHYSSLKSTDACLEVLPFQTISRAMVEHVSCFYPCCGSMNIGLSVSPDWNKIFKHFPFNFVQAVMGPRRRNLLTPVIVWLSTSTTTIFFICLFVFQWNY